MHKTAYCYKNNIHYHYLCEKGEPKNEQNRVIR